MASGAFRGLTAWSQRLAVLSTMLRWNNWLDIESWQLSQFDV